jgi:DNA replication protein DnaC
MSSTLSERMAWDQRTTERINAERKAEGGHTWIYSSFARGEGVMLDSKGRPSIIPPPIPHNLKDFTLSQYKDHDCNAYKLTYDLGKRKSGMVYLCGENTGKSRLCIGLYNGFADRGAVMFADWQRLIDMVQSSWGTRNAVMGTQVLIIDNFLQSPNDRTSAAEIRVTQDIVEARNDPRKATLLASQIPLDAIKKRSRTLASTLREAAEIVIM